MRTQDEIVRKIYEVKDDFFGFKFEVLIPYLDYEHAKKFLKPEVTVDQWDQREPNHDNLLEEMRAYMEFAWGKVQDHRGISASRSIDKIGTWLWLLGDQDTIDKMGAAEYAQYGAPKLKVVCDAYSLPVPNDERISNMIEGRPCQHECYEGCGC